MKGRAIQFAGWSVVAEESQADVPMNKEMVIRGILKRA